MNITFENNMLCIALTHDFITGLGIGLYLSCVIGFYAVYATRKVKS